MEAPEPVHLQQLLQLLLHHTDILVHQRVVGSLLSTSKEVQQVLRGEWGSQHGIHCRFTKSADAKATDSFAAWLKKYGHLVSSLHISTSPMYGFAPAARIRTVSDDISIMAALYTSAKAAPAGLQLQHVSCSRPTPAGLSMLVEVSRNTLTSLQLNIHPQQITPGCSSVSPLAALTALRSLDITTTLNTTHDSGNCEAAILLQPALPALRHLTHLSLTNAAPLSEHVLQLLPPGLLSLQLDVSSCRGGPCAPWTLAHLTALLDLSDGSGSRAGGIGHMLQDSDTLPGQLQRLRLQGMKSVQPLLGLKHLQHLVLHDAASTPYSELLQLSQLGGLTGVYLSYNINKVSDLDSLNNAAQCWALVPLKQLNLRTNLDTCSPEAVHLSSAAVLQLGRCQHLVDLKLEYISLEGRDLAAALKQLRQLQQLSLHDLRLQTQVAGRTMAGSVGHQADMMEGLVQSLAQLSNLHQLSLLRLPLGEQAAALSDGLRLHHLELEDCHLSSSAVLAIVATHITLQHLSLWGNEMVEDDFLAGIAAGQLSQLSYLNLQYTGVTNTAVKEFLSGPRWQMVQVLV
eukprot:gene13260-13390_t